MEIYGCITSQGLQPILLQDEDEVGGDGVDDATHNYDHHDDDEW